MAQQRPPQDADAAEHSATPIADAAEEVAREMWPNGLPDQVESEGSTFRLNIHAPDVAVRAPWLPDPEPVSRRPTGGSIYHQQMLEHVVPQQFRASTFYPAGVSIDPAVIVNGVRGVWRDWQVRRIRAQIARELAELEAVNAVATR